MDSLSINLPMMCFSTSCSFEGLFIRKLFILDIFDDLDSADLSSVSSTSFRGVAFALGLITILLPKGIQYVLDRLFEKVDIFYLIIFPYVSIYSSPVDLSRKVSLPAAEIALI